MEVHEAHLPSHIARRDHKVLDGENRTRIPNVDDINALIQYVYPGIFLKKTCPFCWSRSPVDQLVIRTGELTAVAGSDSAAAMSRENVSRSCESRRSFDEHLENEPR